MNGIVKSMVCGSLALVLSSAYAQDNTGANSTAGTTNSVPASNAVPAIKYKSKNLEMDGIDFGSFISIKTEKEIIGAQLVPKSRIQAENGGRRLIVHLNDSDNNRISIDLLSEELSEWTYESTFPLVSRYFGNSSVMRSPATSMGQPSFVFSAQRTQGGAEMEVRAQVIRCKSGCLVIYTQAVGKNSKEVLFSMQRIVSSLQSAEAENKLVMPRPSNES